MSESIDPDELVSGMDITQKVGLLLHPIVIIDPSADLEAPSPLGGASIHELIVDQGIRTFGLGGSGSIEQIVEFTGRLQQLAISSGSRLPILFSSDPRHGFQENAAASRRAVDVAPWPDPLGFGALDDADLVREFASAVRADYLAMGIRMALHPQVDLATEPRWARQAHSFGADPVASARLGAAFIRGMQGDSLGPDSIAATTKHFPGGGPQLDGEDPHFPYGREQVYPGDRFEEHLLPFRAAIEAGTAAIMPYYGMPVGLRRRGTSIEQVGFAFNKQIITDLLRDELGFDGLVLSDFGLVTDVEIFGKPFPARAWGVEHLDREGRVLALLAAGIDQLGGESDTDLILRLLDRGLLDEQRITESAVRVVRLQSALGLTPATPRPVSARVADRERIDLALRTQSRAMVILSHSAERGVELPLAATLRVHSESIDPDAFPSGWDAVELDRAEVAIERLSSPFEARDHYFLESGMQQGSLEFDADTVERIRRTASVCPVVLVVTLNRPAILSPFTDVVAAIVADFGASDSAVIAALLGRVAPQGSLPFELPRSMDAVVASRPDVASDTADPLFPIGHGLRLTAPTSELEH